MSDDSMHPTSEPSPNAVDDHGLIDRNPMPDDLLHRDFQDFFKAEFTPVVSFLCRAGFTRETAEDSTAVAMKKAHDSWATIATNPHAWVRTTARRNAIKLVTRDRMLLSRLIQKNYGLQAADGTDAFRSLEQQDELLWALGHLRGRQRLVMAWVLDGFTYDEIAQETGIKAVTVRSHLRHARARILQLLSSPDTEMVHR